MSSLGRILSISFNCNYTRADPKKAGLHTSLAVDKSAHDINSAVALADIEYFKDAALTVTKSDRFAMHMLGVDGAGNEVVVNAQGSRTIPRPKEGQKGTYRDTVGISFEQGEISLDAQAGTMVIHRSGQESIFVHRPSLATNYDQQFLALNQHWLECVRGEAEPRISRRATLLSALAIVALEQAPPNTLIDIRV